MARPNPHAKSRKAGKWKKSYKHHTKLKQKPDAQLVKRRKNVKSIQRAKEMEEQHRKQKTVEDKYRMQNKQHNVNLELGLDEAASDEEAAMVEEEENAYDALVSQLSVGDASRSRAKPQVVESSDDSEDEEEEEEEEQDEEGEEEEDMEDEGDEEDIEEEEDEHIEDEEGEEDDEEEEEDDEEEEDEEGEENIEIEEEDNENEEQDMEENEEDEEDTEDEAEVDSEEEDATKQAKHIKTAMVAATTGAHEDESSDSNDKSHNAPTVVEDKSVDKLKRRTLADAETLASNCNSQNNDTFSLYLDYELPSETVEKLLAASTETKKMCLHWPGMGQFNLELPLIERPPEQLKQIEQLYRSNEVDNPAPSIVSTAEDLQQLGVKAPLVANTPLPFTQLQTELFAILNQYQDLFYPERTLAKADEMRLTYCLHTVNHMLKTRSRILHHNTKLTAASQLSAKAKKKSKISALVPDSYRDQGLVRPKVLIIVPFRETAHKVVYTMAQLLHGSGVIEDGKAKCNTIMNYERFVSEYTGQTLRFSKTNPKPEDYEQTFSGNTDDNFRIGVSLTKKCLKLYTDFYASDILLASPLGLRLIIGAPGSAERDYDFLNSIELLIVDQAELILAQNWENLLHVVEHLHLQPQSLRDTDFQRVRPWCLSGLSRFYRQTILFSSHELPEFRALFSSKCCNYQGKVRISNPVIAGDIRNLAVPVSQQFQRVNVTNLESVFDQRFQYFIREVLPRFRGPSCAHCMIYVPSYFDYVRLRNYFKQETISFVQICEYTNKAKMARARDLFFHSGAHFLLYSERSHFYRRTRLKGIRHLIMYQPPVWPHFYSEMINLMHSANQNSRDGLEDSMSITVLYTKYDLLQLKIILGSDTAMKLVQSSQKTHTFAAA